MSLAKNHFQKVMAAEQAANGQDDTVRADANQYDLMMAQLHAHTLELKSIQSVTKKCVKKVEFLPVYTPYIQGVLEAGSGQPDKVLITVMLWSIDAGLFEIALKIAAYALEHNLDMPDTFQRSTACVIAEEIATAALKSTDSQVVPLADLITTHSLLSGADYPDQVKAKLEKALGLGYRADDQLQLAIDHLEIALSLNDKCGVKTDIKSINKQLQDQTDTEANPS
ncbi:MAG: hypothetical protein OFPI_00290 [Osedax symbiont Rs2]|nr:MAG: hypothetical protein OFPI_00290 [Osedax symbiont Rs2]